ncbi:MAG: hypothetical protein HXK26_02445, partial [Lancefieldella rimae]|nr:hypothetical protein [Lancefieldella rimae]
MNLTEELVQRCALKRRATIGPMSDAAYEELLLAVQSDLKSYASETDELPMYHLAQAVKRYQDSQLNDDSYTDEEFVQARITRLQTFLHALKNIREKYGENTDLLRMDALIHASDPESLLQALLAIQNQAEKEAKRTPNLEDSKTSATIPHDTWADVFTRPRLRLQAAIGRAYADTARFKLAATTCEQLLEESPSDAVGARFTLALTYARLEDEAALNRLDDRFNHHSNAWIELARAILLFKLSRISSARRALKSYQMNTEGGAFALLHPTFVDIYIPDRPEVKTGS